jgi:hypothetical protein
MATLAYSNILVIRTKSVSAQGMLCRQPAAEGLIPALAEGLSGAGVSDIALQPLPFSSGDDALQMSNLSL